MKFAYRLTAIGILTAVVAFQIAYLFENYRIEVGSYKYLSYFVSVVFAVIFILTLALLYRSKKIEEQKNRFSGRRLLTVDEYEIMVKNKTQEEVQKLRRSQAYRDYEVDRKFEKGGKSNSKTAASQRHQDEFQEMWLGQERLIFDRK